MADCLKEELLRLKKRAILIEIALDQACKDLEIYRSMRGLEAVSPSLHKERFLNTAKEMMNPTKD